MRKIFQKISGAAICLCLCFLMSISFLISSSAQSRAATDPFHYGSPVLGSNQELSASKLFAALYGFAPTEEEKNYLETDLGITLRYNNIIPDNLVSSYYNGEDGVLHVNSFAYTYMATNGVLVRWIPKSAKLGDVVKEFVEFEGSYGCRFENLFYSDDFDVEISYAWDAEISAESADLLFTKAYADGSEALGKLLFYEEIQLNPYLEALKRYEVYSAYQQALANYAQYVKDLEEYEKKLDLYKAYCQEYQAYLEQLSAYEARQKYLEDLEKYYAYQDFLKNDLERYQAYLIYQNQVDQVQKKINILESLFVKDSKYQTFYPSLMGDTVTSVIANKADLIAAGCSEKDIDLADSATQDLRALLQGYNELRGQTYSSSHEKTTVLYHYYTEHYDALGDAFARLYGALYSLYQNELVVIYADKEGKLARFQQFIGQLYVITTCLDDSAQGMRMENWQIGGKSLSEVVESVHLLADTGDSNPANATMPKVEVERVEEVEAVEKPTVEPPDVPKPNEPKRVEEPVKPTEVTEPDTSNPPPEAEDPGEQPQPPQMTDRLRALAEAIRAGRVPVRSAIGESRILHLEKTITVPISIHNLKTVTFYDADGETVLYQKKVDYGDEVIYRGPAPQKADPVYDYTFTGWIFADGSEAQLDDVRENLAVYAKYQKELHLYRITWIVDGETKITAHPYGEIPQSPFSTQKESTAELSFEFSGWNKEPVAVTEDATYEASFLSSPRLYTVKWILGERELDAQVAYGEIPICPDATPSYVAGSLYYEFRDWDKSIGVVTADVTYTALYTQKTLASAGNGSALEAVEEADRITVFAGNADVFFSNAAQYALENEIALSIRWDHFSLTVAHKDLNTLLDSSCQKISLKRQGAEYGEAFELSYLDRSNKNINLALPTTLSLFSVRENGKRYVYAMRSDDEWVSLKEEMLSLQGDLSLLVTPAYQITVEGNEYCYTASMPGIAGVGQLVSFALNCEFGYEITGALITAEDGTTVEAQGLAFVMPESNVFVRLRVEQIVYHVVFEVNGEIYSEKDYFLGEKIQLPEEPILESDELYSYLFLNWTPVVTIAMGEERTLVFTAVFSKTQLNGVDPYLTGHNNNRLLNLFLPIGLSVLLVGGAIWISLRTRKKKKEPEATVTLEEPSAEKNESEEKKD